LDYLLASGFLHCLQILEDAFRRELHNLSTLSYGSEFIHLIIACTT
jgi:hypothetical protein